MTTCLPEPALHAATVSAMVSDRMRPTDLQISDDVLVDTAIAVMQGAHVDHMLVRGHDGRCTGVLTRAQLAPFRVTSWYTERLAVRDIVQDGRPFATAGMLAGAAAATMRERRLAAWPVVDEDGYSVGLLTAQAM